MAQHHKRFPRKGTCLSIYSRCAGAEQPIEEVVPEAFPWCKPFLDDLKQLFRAYCERKEQAAVLDDDDLLLFWQGLLEQQRSGETIRDKFDCVLVDEDRHTNRLQAAILRRLCPDGGLTATATMRQQSRAMWSCLPVGRQDEGGIFQTVSATSAEGVACESLERLRTRSSGKKMSLS